MGSFFGGLGGGGTTETGTVRLAYESVTLPAGTTDNLNVTGFFDVGLLRVTPNAAGSTLAGIVAQLPADVTMVYGFFLSNVGAGLLTILDEGSATPAYGFAMPGDFILPPESGQGFYYDRVSSRWRILS